MNLELQKISEIAAEPVQFLSAPYIPLGKIVVLQGDPGLGKTSIALTFAAALTTGKPLPWDAKPFGVCDVIFQSMEDGYGDTIKPRLEQLGADCDRVHVIREDEYPVTVRDERLEQAIVKTGAKLLILDTRSLYGSGNVGRGRSSDNDRFNGNGETHKLYSIVNFAFKQKGRKGAVPRAWRDRYCRRRA